jgi:hypothetical protein
MPTRVFDKTDASGNVIFYVKLDGVTRSAHTSQESAHKELVRLLDKKSKEVKFKNPTNEKIEKFNKDPSDKKPKNKM